MAKYSKPIDQVLKDLNTFTDEDRDSMLEFFSSIGLPIEEKSEKTSTAANDFQPVLEQKLNHTENFVDVSLDMLFGNENLLAA
ncbi:hypothetical protein [Lactiplantibacillus plantarum]|uniref:hypothetical protein n=1 Tax=Lactiplantibacillus plantarum TaxID=1590 RepID=UPI00077DF599|nr:hypothetical protein [Lactiplantibacillus plantarum]KYK01293.1 hypothetical protein Lpl43_13490 [Lactiplantibacillus plantarum]MCT3205644.1 hypothetical protein [Lactiplantibacillus plantarum]MCT3219059.1 hypothetical protein [Lactiplantibacillus plantarum]